MKVYNEKHSNLRPFLIQSLEQIRKIRQFDVEQYIQAKSIVLNSYMSNCGLNACVIAISGGIDSAIVASIINYASKIENSPIKKIVGITLPVFDKNSATNQSQTIEKAQALCNGLGIELHTLNTTLSYEKIYPQVENALQQPIHDDWARGQLCAYARTPIIYYCTSVLSSQGYRAIVVGTTNRDEGAYLGYVGKASDGMVDVQLISDLHKNEVYAVAQYLNVPESILSATPTGDMYDGRVDEEVFGAPYDFVEFYLNYKNLTVLSQQSISQFWGAEDWEQFNQYSQALEKLHHYNGHKYWIGSPAIHLDIYPSAVKGGWIEGVHSGIYKRSSSTIIPTHKFVGFVEENPVLLSTQLENHTITYAFEKTQYADNEITEIQTLLQPREVENFTQWIKKNQDKMMATDEYGRVHDQKQFSKRLSFYDTQFTQLLAERLLASNAFKPLRVFDKHDKTNWHPDHVWKFTGINPMVRVIQYSDNGELIAHYDDSLVIKPYQKSLMTLLIIIDNDCEGGATRFIVDPQDDIDFSQRNFNDWSRLADENEIALSLKPSIGNALLFDHRMLHDGQTIKEGKKIVLRTELIFESCIFNKENM